MQITAEIIDGCIQDDRRAQKMLYEYCYRNYIRLCLRYHNNHEDARLALNKSFLKIVNGLQQVDKEELNFGAWAKRIITNTLIDEYRSAKKHNESILSKETDRELEFAAENVENAGAQALSYQEILDLLKTIPPISAHVFTLYVIDGYNHKEIGDLLEISEGTSKWHLSTARKLLRDRLEMMENRNEKKFVL